MTKNPSVLYQMACACDARGDEAQAAPLYEAAIQNGLQGDDLRGALLGLGSTYRCLGQYSESLRTLDRGIQEFPSDRSFAVFRSLTLFNLGQAQASVSLLLKQLLETTQDPTIRSYERALRFYSDCLKQVWPGSADYMEQPRIETSRLILEPYQDSDVDDVFAYASHPEVSRFVPWETHQSRTDAEAFLGYCRQNTSHLRGRLFFVFTLRLKGSGRVVGSIDFKNVSHTCGQIDYALGYEHWNKGLVTEAAQAVRDWALQSLPEMVRLQAFCALANVGSARVMEKIGMQKEGVRRKAFVLKGVPMDLADYALIR